MLKIEIYEERHSKEQLATMLEAIAEEIRRGHVHGIYNDWRLNGTIEPELEEDKI